MKPNTIFIQIASYRDPQLIPTIKSCLENAKYPDNLVFSIAWQHSPDDTWDNLDEFKCDERFKIKDIYFKDSKGCCWARNLLQQQYDDEEYTLQLDSHHRFVENWDEKLLLMYKQLKDLGHEKPLITSYAPSFNPNNDPEERVTSPYKMNFHKFIPEGAVFFLPATMDDHATLTQPIPARFYSAHFAFTTGKFVKEVPHDPLLFFHGEEISITVRAYTWGYDLFHPHIIIAWHEYTRANRVKQWDDDAEWWKKNEDSHARNRTLFEMDGAIKNIDFGVYDFGPVRTLSDYEQYAGLSFKHRSATRHTLQHLDPPSPFEEHTHNIVFNHSIQLNKHTLFPFHDYDFWAVIYEDISGKSLFRRDLNKSEIQTYLMNDTIKIDVQFDCHALDIPHKWIVWPHSDEGWLKKIENTI